MTSNAKTINTEAAAWVERRDRAEWREGDEVQFKAWLAQSTAHLIAYHRMHDAWLRSEKLVVLRESVRVHARRSIVPMMLKAAAIAVALAVLGAVAIVLQRPSDRVYATAIGEHQTLSLADDTKVELNTDTRLRVSRNGRYLVLDRGEAFFQVRHDSHHPFVVSVGTHRVTDLGTKFDIRKDSDRLKVILVEGRARIDEADASARPIILSSGDVLVATSGNISLKRQSQASAGDALGWRHDVIVFDHTAFKDAVAEMNRYNHKQIVVADSEAAKAQIGGTFPVNGTSQLAEVAHDLFGFRVQDKGDEIVISR